LGGTSATIHTATTNGIDLSVTFYYATDKFFFEEI